MGGFFLTCIFSEKVNVTFLLIKILRAAYITQCVEKLQQFGLHDKG